MTAPPVPPPVEIRRRSPDPAAERQLPRTLPPLLRRIYSARGIRTEADYRLALTDLHPADGLLDIQTAAERLADEIQQQGKLLILGDYDVDGATGTAVAVRGLRALGAERLEYLIPNRFHSGYGLNPQVLEAAQALQPDLLITVDNGIAAQTAVAQANDLGIPIIITDHHLPGDELPAAEAIVNPNRSGDPFPSKNLAGVGVIFYLLAAVRAQLRARGWFHGDRPEPNLGRLLDLVALGTVADVVSLDRNNRILVHQGLVRIRSPQGNPGIRALLRIAGRNPDRAVAQDLAFAVAPRLNAAGRLDDMSLGVACLLAETPEARSLAKELDQLNRDRRQIEGDMKRQAETELRDLEQRQAALPPGLCLYRPDWHQGLTGILAGRMRERWHRPVIAFAPTGAGRLQGSGRSVEGLHLRDLLGEIDRQHPELIAGFGGHAMAVGLRLSESQLPTFRAVFSEAVGQAIGETPRARILLSDGALGPRDFNLHTAQLLRQAGPWGKDFPEPLFDGEFHVLQYQWVGKDQHLRLRVRSVAGGFPLGAIAFYWQGAVPEGGTLAHLAYHLDVNEFRGVLAPQLLVVHLEWLD